MIGKIIFVGLLATGIASAQKAPRGTFNASQFAEAKAEAAAEGKNIAVIYTEIDSTCPKCRWGTEVAFKKMRSDYVLVLEDKAADSETGTLPRDVKQKTYLTYKRKGNFIPIITVFSPDAQRVLSGACYNQIAADERKWLKTIEEEIASQPAAESKPTETPAAPTEAAASGAGKGGVREWTDVQGRTMKAEFVHADDITVTFKLENGKVIDLPMARLSEASRTLVAECR